MPKLFIANLSKQHQHFLYRLPEWQSTRAQDIAIGAQVQIPGDLSDTDIAYVIEKHRAYGMKSVQEARRIKGFTGLVYDIDRPVNLGDQGFIDEVQESNDDTLTERSNERREQTTAAISERLRQVGEGTREPLRRTEVEQVEETEGTPQVAVGVEAVAENVAPRNQSPRRAGK
jgi:hypothetical protein